MEEHDGFVDSRKKLLVGPEVILQFAKIHADEEFTFDTILMGVLKELADKNADIIQIGNTVFLAHKTKDDHKHKNVYVGRALNADTAPNLITNMVKYIHYLHKKKAVAYITEFESGGYEKIIRLFHRRQDKALHEKIAGKLYNLEGGGFRMVLAFKYDKDK